MAERAAEPQIIAFESLTDQQREEAAAVLLTALAHVPSAWRDMAAAREEVASFFDDPQRSAIAALDGDTLIGWIGAIRHSVHAFELHPLVVDPRDRCPLSLKAR